jgi:hypothetical protein
MAYEIRLTSEAQKVWDGLPPGLQHLVENHLLRLGDSPSSASRPAVSPPYPPSGMIYEFDSPVERGILHHFTVFFRYGQDEKSLSIYAIGHGELKVGP